MSGFSPPSKPPARPGCGRVASATPTISRAAPILFWSRSRRSPPRFAPPESVRRRGRRHAPVRLRRDPAVRAFPASITTAPPPIFFCGARLAAAKTRLAETDEPIAAIAYAAGFETLSVFHENFRRLNGLTPRRLSEVAHGPHVFRGPAGRLSLELPPARFEPRSAQRDERFEGDTYRAGVWLDATPAVLTLQLAPRALQVAISAGSAFAAHALVVGLAGLEQDSAAFGRAVRQLGFARLVARSAGLRISQTPSVFDGPALGIIGHKSIFPSPACCNAG